MDEQDWIKQLDRGAAPAQGIDVADWVLRDLRATPPQPEAALRLMAAISSVAAVIALAAAFQAYSALADPLGDLVVSLTTVLQ